MKYGFIFLVVAFVSGCSSVSVTRDYERSVDFSTLQTYAWQHEKQEQSCHSQLR